MSGARLREVLAHRLTAVTLFPFEVFMTILMILTGAPILLGLQSVPVLVHLVGSPAFYAWAAGTFLSGATLGLGLLTRTPLAVSSGLQLAAVCLVVFVIALAVLFGIAAWPNLVIHGVLALVSLARALHFRRLIDIQIGANRLWERGK